MGDHTAFAMGLITSALQWIFVMFSWILTTYYGRRAIYLWGSAVNTILLFALGIAGAVSKKGDYAGSTAQAALGLIISVGFTLGPAPASWVIIGETSAIRLRPLTTGMGRAVYYIVEFPCIFLASYMLNPTGGNRKSHSIQISYGQTLTSLSRRQVRFRLGCYRLLLLGHGIFLPS